jgi:hypothetical protein
LSFSKKSIIYVDKNLYLVVFSEELFMLQNLEVTKELILTVGMCAVIFIWFLIEVFKLYFRSRPLRDQIKKAVDVISYEADERLQFLKKFESIDKTLCGLKVYSHAWKEFKEHLLFPSDDDEIPEIKNSILPEVFFSQDTVVYENINQKHYDAVPGYLTGLGVFGTFLGFILGLSSLDITTLNANDMTGFKEGIGGLLAGASTAFYTSAFGIATSILYSIFEKWRIRRLDEMATDFVDSLEKCLKFTTQEQQQQVVIDLLKDVRNNSDAFINDFISRLEQSFTSMLETHVVANVNNSSANIVNALSSIKDIQKDSQKDLLENISSQLTGGLQSTASEAQKNAMEQFGSLQGSFQESMEKMLEAQTNSQEANQRLLTEVSSSTNGVIENVQTSINNLMDNFEQQTKNGQEKMGDQLNQIMSQIGEATNKGAENIQSKLSQSAENISTAFDQVSTKFIDANLNLAEKVEKGGEKYQEGSNRISTSAEVFRSTVGSLQENLVSMREIANSQMNIATSNQNSANSFNTSLENIEELTSTIKSQNETIGNLTNSLNEERGILQSSTSHLTEQWQQYTERFAEVDESLERAFKLIREGNDGFIEQYNALTDKTVKSVGQISNTLSDAIRELEDALTAAGVSKNN